MFSPRSSILIFFPNETKNLVFLFSTSTHKMYFVFVFQAFCSSQHKITSACSSILLTSYFHLLSREFMAKEEIQNPQTVETEKGNMMNGQILLNEQRLEWLQHLMYDWREYSNKSRILGVLNEGLVVATLPMTGNGAGWPLRALPTQAILVSLWCAECSLLHLNVLLSNAALSRA